MSRGLRVFSIVAVLIAMVLLCLWWSNGREAGATASSNFRAALQSAVTNPMDFVKSRITGGIGLVIIIDKTAKLPKICGVLPGSPAGMAGLRAGDVLVKVDDRSAAGQTLFQLIAEVRGFTGESVKVTVSRGGSNITYTVRRSSWNALRGTNQFQTPS